MADLQSCCDISDAKPFYPKRNLYLKPLLKINISIQLPSLKLVGKSISNVTLIENIRNWASPDKFYSVKVTKSTLESIRFEADLYNPSKVYAILARLDGKQVTLPGFKETVKVRASIAKTDFPVRHDWDSFFRDAKHMNEMKAGERPDTLHISDLPIKWFSTKLREDLPSESLIKKIFERFGEVTVVDIPSIDPYRSKMKAHLSGLKLFNFNQNTTFEAYIQFRDYIAFVNAMDYLRGMKLLRIESDVKAFTTNIKVDFDRTKHLSEYSIRKRKIEREKLMAKDRELEEKRQKFEDELKMQDNEKEEKDCEKELAIKKPRKEKKNCCCKEVKTEESETTLEEKNLLLTAQRKLESIRLLTELLTVIKKQKENYLLNISKNKDDCRADLSQITNAELIKVQDNLKSAVVKIDVACEVTLNSNRAGNRLHSEVVKVKHPDCGNSMSDNQAFSNYEDSSLYMNVRNSWQRGGRGGKQGWCDYYYRNAHHLYYKYFQSLTRDKSTMERDHHLRSKTPNRSQIDDHSDGKETNSSKSTSRSRTRSKSRSLSLKRLYQPKIFRKFSKRISSPVSSKSYYNNRSYSRDRSIS